MDSVGFRARYGQSNWLHSDESCFEVCDALRIRRSLFIAVLPVTLSVWAAETGEWLLAGQEGKCIPLSALTKKGPEFQDIKSPYELVEKMRAAGHKAEIKEHKAGTRPAVEVRVPLGIFT